MSADEIFYAPAEELLLESEQMHRNEGSPGWGIKSRRRRSKRTVELPEADLYAGFEKLLVRTALVRAEGYQPKFGPVIDSAEDVAELTKHLSTADNEYLVTLAINASNRLLAIHEAGVGPTSEVATTAQQLLKVAFLTSASALIIVHNHPSGIPRPSPEDARMTASVIRATRCVGLPLLDHVIIAIDGWTSFADTNGGLEHAAENYELTRFAVRDWRHQ